MPPGMVLNSFLFPVYILCPCDFIQFFGFKYHLYSFSSQIYISGSSHFWAPQSQVCLPTWHIHLDVWKVFQTEEQLGSYYSNQAIVSGGLY